MSKAHACTDLFSISGGKNCRRTCSRCWIWLHCQIYQQLPNQSRQKKPHYSSLMFQLIKERDYNTQRLPAKQAFCLSVILPRSHIYHQVFHNYANLDIFFFVGYELLICTCRPFSLCTWILCRWFIITHSQTFLLKKGRERVVYRNHHHG